MKVFINGFWDGFIENTDPNKCFVLFLLFRKVFNCEILIGNLNNSDILLESVFSDKTYINYKKWKYTFFFNGESIKYLFDKGYARFREIPNYDCILSGRFTDYNKKIINFPLFVYYIYSNNYLPILMKEKTITTVPKKNVCAIISNKNKNLERNYFLEKLEKKIHIDYAGTYKNNVPRIEGAYNSEQMFQFISQYKFVIAMENFKQETYITEKIINGFISNTIPIYWGSDNIFDYFNPNRFINVPNMKDEVIDVVIDNLIDIINDDNKYLNIINSHIFNNNELSRTIENISNEIKNLIFK